MLNARPVAGRWRNLRSAANLALIAILFGIPWIRIGGEPLVLLDIPARKFHVFGLVIFPQELYFLWLILAVLALALFFFTALFGRVWCGWACPQTVFTDVFAGIARRIEGWRGSRPPRKIAVWRRVATHAVWIAASALIGFHLVGYFHSPYRSLAEWSHGEVSPVSLGFIAVVSALAYLDFVFVRQIFCKMLCPYARFQGVLFDSDTLVIGYDTRRGEPRGKRGTTSGSCVDCGLCVAVCPSEIDIREGMQLECIACTQCIDACNGVMAKLGRDPDLIGYRSLVSLEHDRPARILRPRVVVYAALLALTLLGFTLALEERVPMDMMVWRNRDSLYTTMPNGQLANSFIIHIENRDRAEHAFHLRVEEPGFELVAGVNPIPLAPISSLETRVFVVTDNDAATLGARDIRFVLEREDDARAVVRSSRFVSPGAHKESSNDG